MTKVSSKDVTRKEISRRKGLRKEVSEIEVLTK